MSNDQEIDADNPEWTEDDFRRARPTVEVLGEEGAAALTRKTVLQRAFELTAPWLTYEKLAA